MINNITTFFLSRYRDAPIEIREKARLFLYLITSTFTFISLFFVVVNMTLDLRVTNHILLSMGLGIVISLSLLKRGRYHVAVNFFSIIFVAGITFLIFYGQIVRGTGDYVTNLYFFPVIVIYTALFCRPWWIVFTTIQLLAVSIASYLINHIYPVSDAQMRSAYGTLVDSAGSTIITLALCFTITVLNRRITEAARREEHTRELHAELEIARIIQSNLMPEAPTDDPRISICANYLPMEEIGGDFYDFLSSGNELHIFVADVSGHGIPGAFMALISKVALIHSQTDSGTTTDVLCHINDVLCDCTVLGNFVSGFYCRIDKSSKKIHYTSAGHIPQILFRRRDKSFHELYSKGMVMGLESNIPLAEKTIDLESGDRLILFTDGVTECMNSKREMFSEERLRDFIMQNSHLPVDTFSASLITHLVDFSRDEKFHDDVTLITLDIN